MTSRSSSLQLRTLLGLRQAGFLGLESLAERLSESNIEVAAVLAQLAQAGEAVLLEGRLAGWMLTDAGRTTGEKLLSKELDDASSRQAVAAAYREFRALNQRFLAVCSDWQVRELDGTEMPNRHDDKDYDAAVLSRLKAIHNDLVPILVALAARLERYEWYQGSFVAALRHLADGDRDYFTKPMLRSYHSIWFELHEDLLATLNLDRTSEG